MFHPAGDYLPFSLSFTTYQSALQVYHATYQHLTQTQAQEINTHVILSHILKLCTFEHPSPLTEDLLPSSPISAPSGSELSPSPPPLLPGNLWVAGWSGPADDRTLRFLVSLTQGQIDQHPLFVVDLQPGSMDAPSLRAAMNQVAAIIADYDQTTVERVYAVFGPSDLAMALSSAWCNQAQAGFSDDDRPLVSYMECTKATLTPGPILDPRHRIRRAGSNDVDLAAQLCMNYPTPPYTLDLANARQEARTLIADKALFFYEVPDEGGVFHVASMLGVGRNSINVASVTKLCTLDGFTRQGYAFSLMHHVCSRLLNDSGKSAVVTYAPTGSDTYIKLLGRVGFSETTSGYGKWLEIGFDGPNLGHW